MNERIQKCTDCFAYRPKYCTILTEMICKTRKCSFYKTKEQFEEGLKKYPPMTRISSLAYGKEREGKCVTDKTYRAETGK